MNNDSLTLEELWREEQNLLRSVAELEKELAECEGALNEFEFHPIRREDVDEAVKTVERTKTRQAEILNRLTNGNFEPINKYPRKAFCAGALHY